jgi:uncharacterized DUF497 family protein
MQDYSEELKQLIKKYKEKGFEYGKPKDYLEFRNGCSIEEMEKELLSLDDLKFTEKQIKEGEKRYKLYFIYTKKKGRAYAVTFREKIRIITIYPLGPGTLNKYPQTKFKK